MSEEIEAEAEAEAEANRDEAVRKALRVMVVGGSIDGEDGELAYEAGAGQENQSDDDDGYVALVHKAMQTTEDPDSFDGPVFPYWYVNLPF